MIVRSRLRLAALVGCVLAARLPAAEPPAPLPPGALAASPSVNQQMADRIAERLRRSGELRHYNVDVGFQDGTADLSGRVADQGQREEVLRLVQGVPGVERVRDRLGVADAVRPAQALQPGAPVLPPPAPEGAVPGPVTPPAPVYQAPPGPHDLTPPRMPPYAWPTYAPYNNYARVAYPEAYPYNAWPFIGPMYPFPKIPLGWRAVKLEWDDGTWWYSRVGTKHDWWKVRYR